MVGEVRLDRGNKSTLDSRQLTAFRIFDYILLLQQAPNAYLCKVNLIELITVILAMNYCRNTLVLVQNRV